VKSTNYEAPHYAIFSLLLFSSLLGSNILLSTLFSECPQAKRFKYSPQQPVFRMPSSYVLPSGCNTKFNTHTQQ
jgi:hypothetical protein